MVTWAWRPVSALSMAMPLASSISSSGKASPLGVTTVPERSGKIRFVIKNFQKGIRCSFEKPCRQRPMVWAGIDGRPWIAHDHIGGAAQEIGDLALPPSCPTVHR